VRCYIWKLAKKEDYEEARRLLFKQISICPSHPAVPLYNLACVEALLGNSASALLFLQKAVQAGYTDVTHMEQDRDFVSIFNLEEFKDIVAKLKQQESEKITLEFKAHIHALTRAFNLPRHTCDVCNTPNITDSFRCSKCDFDLCLSCAHPENEAAKESPSKNSEEEVPKVEVPEPQEAPKETNIPPTTDPIFLPFVPIIDQILQSFGPIVYNAVRPNLGVPAEHEESLKVLQEMGWIDRQRNIQVLLRTSGDLAAAVQILLDEQ